MDIQLKRGMLDVCVLAAIKDEDSYGYKIIKDMKPYIEMSESTLYTILKRLELSNMLTVWVRNTVAGFGNIIISQTTVLCVSRSLRKSGRNCCLCIDL